MAELTLEAVEKLLTKQLENLATKKDIESLEKSLTAKIEASADELGEMIQFLTKTAAHKEDLQELAKSEHMDKRFAEQGITLSFIETQLSTLRKDLVQLAQRTKEDDGAFVKELLKLKNRMDQFEKQLKKLKLKTSV